MIEEFVSRVFADRDASNIEHFRTKSYAAHMALGDFYEQVIDTVDAVVECHQGMFGLIGPVELEPVPYSIERMKESADWMEVNRLEIANEAESIAALVDDVVAVYARTIYKLENLL